MNHGEVIYRKPAKGWSWCYIYYLSWILLGFIALLGDKFEVIKSVGKAWTDLSRDTCRCWRHIQSAHIWVCSLPFTLLSLNSVRSFCSVCPVSPIPTGSIVASYSTWRQQWLKKIHPGIPPPAFCTASDKSWAWRPENEATLAGVKFILVLSCHIDIVTCTINGDQKPNVWWGGCHTG